MKRFLLVFDLLFDVSVGLLRDEGNQVLHALWSQQEVHQFVVLGLALLQDVVFIHHLQQCDILFLQQRVDVRRGMEVKFPKHGDSEHANRSNDLMLEKSSPPPPHMRIFPPPTSRYVLVRRTELSLKTDRLLSLGVVAHSKLQCQWTDRQTAHGCEVDRQTQTDQNQRPLGIVPVYRQPLHPDVSYVGREQEQLRHEKTVQIQHECMLTSDLFTASKRAVCVMFITCS